MLFKANKKTSASPPPTPKPYFQGPKLWDTLCITGQTLEMQFFEYTNILQKKQFFKQG